MLENFENFYKLNDQGEKLVKLNFGMINLNAIVVNVNNKSYNIFIYYCFRNVALDLLSRLRDKQNKSLSDIVYI